MVDVRELHREVEKNVATMVGKGWVRQDAFEATMEQILASHPHVYQRYMRYLFAINNRKEPSLENVLG